MFKSYMEFILNNAENSNLTKDIIYINQNMLYRLNKKKYISRFNIGGQPEQQSEQLSEHAKELKKFKDSTISIIKKLGEPVKEQQELLIKAEEALTQLIKYIDMLYDYSQRENLKTISQQLKELQEKIKQY